MTRIRHADPERDGAACAAIYEPFVTEGAASFEEEPPSPAQMTRRIATMAERYPWLVAEADGAVVGFAYASVHRERAAYRWGVEVTAYIADRHRRRGVGRALYDSLFELLRRQGIQVALAGITLPNDASVGLHEACGFELVGIYRRIGWKHGQWRDVGWWQLELVPRSADPPAEPGRPARLEAV